MAEKLPKPNIFQRLRDRRLFLIVIVILLCVIAGVAVWVLLRKDNKPQPEAQQSTVEFEEQFYPEEYVMPDEAKDLYTVEGEITKVSGQAVTVKSGDSSQDFKVTNKTYYKKGQAFEAGDSAGVKTGIKVQVTADRNSKEVYSIWYGY